MTSTFNFSVALLMPLTFWEYMVMLEISGGGSRVWIFCGGVFPLELLEVGEAEEGVQEEGGDKEEEKVF